MMIIRQGWVNRDHSGDSTILFRGAEESVTSPIPEPLQEKATLFIGGERNLHLPIDTLLGELLASQRALRRIREELMDPENLGAEEALREGLRLALDEAERAGVGEGKGTRVPDVGLVPKWAVEGVIRAVEAGLPVSEAVVRRLRESLNAIPSVWQGRRS